MGSEWRTSDRCSCPCGNGRITEQFRSDDHPYGNFSWDSHGLQLECNTCSQEWVVVREVSNRPTLPSGQTAVYLVSKSKYQEVISHNNGIDAQISTLWNEQSNAKHERARIVRETQIKLLQQVDQNGSRITQRFASVGQILGFKDIESFKFAVGRTFPKTYIPAHVTSATIHDVLDRLGDNTSAEEVKRLTEKVNQLENTKAQLNAQKRLHRMEHYICYPIQQAN